MDRHLAEDLPRYRANILAKIADVRGAGKGDQSRSFRTRSKTSRPTSENRRCPEERSRGGRRSRQGRRPNRSFDSNLTSVEKSAAAEEQHHQHDDEQSGRVHFLSCVFGERGPASSRPVNARDDRRRFGAAAVRITPTPTCRLTAVQAGVCSLLDTAINARSLTRVVREMRRTIDLCTVSARSSG